MKKIASGVFIVLFSWIIISWAAEPININTADLKTLETIKGIGPKKAADIIAYREKNGPFKQVEDLKKVKGIGDGFIKKHLSLLTVGDAAAATETPEGTANKKESKDSKKEAVDDTTSGLDTALPDEEVVEEPEPKQAK